MEKNETIRLPETETIRHLTQEENRRTAEIERLCFGTPWSEAIIADTIRKAQACCEDAGAYRQAAIGIFEDGKLAGYLFGTALLGEGELHRIAVDPAFRGRGFADQLMQAFLAWLSEQQADAVLLEVRCSNRPAIALYEKYGFVREGVRKNYYQNPQEDAGLYRRG